MSELPLVGMKVLDLSRALSGPFCSMILGDLGADVIKVEPSPNGDMIRTWGPFDRGESAYYLSGNRNKRSIGLDFRSDQGRKIIRRIALQCDVMVENFKPGTLAKMGLAPEELRAIKPELIIASISGFGAKGPLRDEPGFDQIAQGYSGFMSFTGTSESGPTRVGVAIGDMTSGMWLAIGVLAAWSQRQATGRGQIVETSLLASLIGLLSVQGQRYLSLGDVPGPTGNIHPVIAPYGVFRASDGDINIGAATQDMWLRLCNVVDRPDLKTDERFLDNARRMERRDELHAIMEGELARHTREDWTLKLSQAGIPAGPINTIRDVLESEQVKSLDLVEEFVHPDLGLVRQVSNPLRLSELSDQWIQRPPPVFAEHTKDILCQFGFDLEEIDELEAKGVILQRQMEDTRDT